MKVLKARYYISIILFISLLVSCNFQSGRNKNNNASNSYISSENVFQVDDTVSSDIKDTVIVEDCSSLPEVTHDELISFELYRPSLTEQEAIEEGFEFIESSSGKEYSNEYATYYFLDDFDTPYAMKVSNLNPYSGPRNINIGSSLDSIIQTIPNHNGWSYESNQSFIYGSQTNFDEAPKNAVNANFNENGFGSLTIVTEGGLPYVQFRFEDWKVINFTYYYEYIN